MSSVTSSIQRCRRGDLQLGIEQPALLFRFLNPVLERFDLDTENWVRNVESYGGLFYRIAGTVETIAARAREKGSRWLRGKKGSRALYRNLKAAA